MTGALRIEHWSAFLIGEVQRETQGSIGLQCVRVEPFPRNLFPVAFSQNDPLNTEKRDCRELVKRSFVRYHPTAGTGPKAESLPSTGVVPSGCTSRGPAAVSPFPLSL